MFHDYLISSTLTILSTGMARQAETSFHKMKQFGLDSRLASRVREAP